MDMGSINTVKSWPSNSPYVGEILVSNPLFAMNQTPSMYMGSINTVKSWLSNSPYVGGNTCQIPCWPSLRFALPYPWPGGIALIGAYELACSTEQLSNAVEE